MPVIVPDKGGHVDYISDHNKDLLFDCYPSPYINAPGYDCDMNLFEPDILSLRKKLRLAYNLWKENKLREIGAANKSYIKENNYDSLSIGKELFSIISSVSDKTTTYKDKIESLRNSHSEEDCYILTCGPSLKNYSKEFLKEKLKDKTVIAIKQAYEVCPEIVDYHIFNSNNFEKYDYKEHRPFSIACSADSEPFARKNIWGQDQEYDLFLHTPDDRNYDLALCNTHDFESFTFERTLDRPWGPGMMTESVLYFALHLGFKNIHTIGWDLEESGSKTSKHFYEKRDLIRQSESMKEDEIEKNILCSLKFYDWLKENNCNLYISNKSSYVHKNVPRKILEE